MIGKCWWISFQFLAYSCSFLYFSLFVSLVSFSCCIDYKKCGGRDDAVGLIGCMMRAECPRKEQKRHDR